MKYIYLLIAVSFVLQSCTKNLDGSKTFGLKGSSAWWGWAPHEDKMQYLSDNEVYQLCAKWDKWYDKPNRREIVSQVLIEKNQDPMLCRNPELDRAKRLEDRVEAAERKARIAKKKARDAEWEAKQAERRARDAERRAREW
jgi:hypothetical protein|tara:strand:- start:39 stop:461 length:423 start_codon:yes stop_codon:yes gene_type:complete